MTARLRFCVLGVEAGRIEVTPQTRGVPLEEAVRGLDGAEAIRLALRGDPTWVLDCAGTARWIDRQATLGTVADQLAGLGAEEGLIDLSVEARGGA
jgi:hypothetical protein